MLVRPGFLLRHAGGAAKRRIADAIHAIFHIDGRKGLVTDAAGGTLVNGRTSTKTIVDFEGNVVELLPNEIGYSGGRRVENLFGRFGWSAKLDPNINSPDSGLTHNVSGLTGNNQGLSFSVYGIKAEAMLSITIEVKADVPKNIGKRVRVILYDASFTKLLTLGDEAGARKRIVLTGDYVQYTFSSVIPSTLLGDGEGRVWGEGVDFPSGFSIRNVQVVDETGSGIKRTVDTVNTEEIYNSGVNGVSSFANSKGLLHSFTIYGDSFTTPVNSLAYQMPVLAGVTYRSAGVSGHTLDQVKSVMLTEAPYLTDDFIILEGGVNTLTGATSGTVDQMKIDMTAMTAHASANGLEFIVLTVAPWGNYASWTSQKQVYTEEYNQWLRVTYPNCTVDMYEILGDVDNSAVLSTDYDSGDFIHPNLDGYFAVTLAIFDVWVALNNATISPLPNVRMRHDPAATNLLTWSEDLSNVAWTKSDATTDSATTASFPINDSFIRSGAIFTGMLPLSYSIKASGIGTLNICFWNSTDGFYGKTSVSLASSPTVIHIQGTPAATDNNRVYFGRHASLGTGLAGTATSVTVEYQQLETGSYATAYIKTEAAPVSRSVDSINAPMVEDVNFYQGKGILLFKWVAGHDLASASGIRVGLLAIVYSSLSIVSCGASYIARTHDGTSPINKATPETILSGDTILASVCWNATESLFSINYSLDDGITWSTWSQAAYDGEFTTDFIYRLFFNNPYINELDDVIVYKVPEADTIAEMQDWVVANGGTETS